MCVVSNADQQRPAALPEGSRSWRERVICGPASPECHMYLQCLPSFVTISVICCYFILSSFDSTEAGFLVCSLVPFFLLLLPWPPFSLGFIFYRLGPLSSAGRLHSLWASFLAVRCNESRIAIRHSCCA